MSNLIINRFNQVALKVSSNTVIFSLREGYIALIPFFIVASLITLLNQWLDIGSSSNHKYFNDFNALVWGLFPLFSLISFSYHLSKNLNIHSIASPIIVVICFATVTGYISIENNTIAINHTQGVFYAILMPIFCCYLLHQLSKLDFLKIVNVSSISLFLRKHINLIFPYLVVTSVTLFVFPYINHVGIWLYDNLLHVHFELTGLGKLYFQLISTHLLWFFGVHGDNTFHILAPLELSHYVLEPDIVIYQFFTSFVLLGGTGCVWGIIIASFFIKEAHHEQHIAKLSLPLAVFNISEVMIYALPIVFNPFILIPFLLAPALNAIVSYLCIYFDVFSMSNEVNVPWFTPIFINAWMLTESYIAVLIQGILVLLNAAIYYPFLKACQKNSMPGKALEMLVKRYSAGREIESKAESIFAVHHGEFQLEHDCLKQVTDALNRGALVLHYQPKINLQSGEIDGFEALIRLRLPNGHVEGPWFLNTLARHNLLEVIDNFVIDQLEVDLESFKKAGAVPKISFNMSPDNLLNGGYKRVIKAFSKYQNQVEVELLESVYIEDFKSTIGIVELLKSNHINCAMDDFGTGYSCLSVLSKLNIDTIKLDRSLLPDPSNTKSKTLYLHLAQLCKQLGFKTVAEGVETTEQELIVKQANIDLVQGFLYYQAMPVEEAIKLLGNTQKVVV
ncbi:EAL domain-containing protein [Pseudoalteromonas sp. A25]|uniref:EAL domain-containing protein n=1 Tax=Pseudoalteromonas sp. A25 TaxID=116092 RepID=UPI001E60B5D8|nr:EAL domain-containing protein [Pseudoalteromonas sp. A25]